MNPEHQRIKDEAIERIRQHTLAPINTKLGNVAYRLNGLVEKFWPEQAELNDDEDELK